MRIKRKLKGILIEQEVVEWKQREVNLVRLYVRTLTGDLIYCVGLQDINLETRKYDIGKLIKLKGHLIHNKDNNILTFYISEIIQ